MKGFIVILTGLAALLLGGWSVAGQQVSPSTELRLEPGQATMVEEIAGTWHAFPVGLVLQFNDDGSAQFGLDWDGTAIGNEAEIEFEGQELSIRFTNYDGQNEACASSAGLYTVQLHQSGNISFEPVQDDCQFRMDILSGTPEAGFRLMYHPVQN